VVPEARKRRGAASKASTSIKGTGVGEAVAENIDALILQLIDTNQRLKEKVAALEAGEAEELLEEARIHTRSLEDLVLGKDEKIKALTEAFDANEVKAEQMGRRCHDLEAQLSQLKTEHAAILAYQASQPRHQTGNVQPNPSSQATNSASQPWTYRPTGHIKSMGGLRF
jgi:phage shock protein A